MIAPTLVRSVRGARFRHDLRDTNNNNGQNVLLKKTSRGSSLRGGGGAEEGLPVCLQGPEGPWRPFWVSRWESCVVRIPARE